MLAALVALTACGPRAPADAPPPSVATPTPSAAAPAPTPSAAAPAADVRVRAARDRAARGELPEAATALRALVDDPSAGARARAEARLALVELWLDYEEGHQTPPACLSPAAPRVAGARAESFFTPPRFAARGAARTELECAVAAGLDVAAARARIEAQARQEASACEARGDRPMEGHAFALMVGSEPSDACAVARPGLFGPILSPLDRRLGVEPPPGPSDADQFIVPPPSNARARAPR